MSCSLLPPPLSSSGLERGSPLPFGRCACRSPPPYATCRRKRPMWTKELRRHKGRTIATSGAVASAMALLMSMLSISNGIIATVESDIRDSSADLLVGARYDTNFPHGHSIATNLSSWGEIDFASPALRSIVTVHVPGSGAPNLSAVAL